MWKKHKRSFSFSTRTLLLGVAVLAVLFAIFGKRTVREVNERRATSEILKLGGRFDCLHARSLPANGWASRVVSFALYEDFSRVTHVSLDRTGVRDEDLAILESLPRLEGLDISTTRITDAGVESLAAIPHLKYVNVHQTNLTEAGVARLKSQRPSLVVDCRWNLRG
jgi:hypothetical protein